MPDNKVDGTNSNQNMGTGFTDADGDQIGAGNDLINANGGDDTIDAGAGDDTLLGGAGRDFLYGRAGNDYIDGGAGHDQVFAGAGNDTILISPIGESAFGEADADTFIVVADAGGFIPGGSLHVNGDSTGIDNDTLDLSQMAAEGWTITSTTQATDGQDSPFVAGNGGFNGTYTLTKAGFQSFIVNYVDIENFRLTAPGPVDGTAGADTMNPGYADAQGDQIDGTDGLNDTVLAGGGNDIVDAGQGNDTVQGDAGDDTLTGGDGNDSLIGDAGSDSLIGGAGNDTLIGGDGDDDLILGAGDRGDGGAGDDEFRIDPVLTGTAGVTIIGGEIGEDLTDPTNGGAGDVLDLRGLTGVVVSYTNPDPLTGTSEAGTATYLNAAGQPVTITFSQIETVLRDRDGVVDGTAGGDLITPTSGPGGLPYTDPQGDQVDGTDGLNDSIVAGAGNDTIDAGVGNDTVDAGTGADRLTGGAGDDSLLGGDGSDTLAGGAGADTLSGGAGDDDIALSGADVVSGGSGDDVFTLDPTDSALNVAAMVDGGTDGTVGAGEDAANGNSGDVLDLSSLTGPLNVVLAANPETGTVNGLDSDAGTDLSFTEIERLLTGAGNDTINGSAATGPVVVDAGAGNDSLIGGSANDSLIGGDGADTLTGGEGTDTLAGGARDDDFRLGSGDNATGGDGDDEFRVDPALTGTAGITVVGGESVEEAVIDPTNNPGGRIGDVLDLRGLAGVVVSYTNPDPLTGTSEAGTATYLNSAGQPVSITFSQIETVVTDPPPVVPDGVVNGGSGDDAMPIGFIDPQGDQIDGADGLNDSINAGAGNDVVDAGLGNDSVDAGTGNDSVFGDAGNDTLAGGSGDDSLAGGDNNDTLTGGDGNDRLEGDAGDDTLRGEDGNDTLMGDAGNDILDGGAGNDSMLGGDGADSAEGGDGDDVINTRAAVASPDAGFPGFGPVPFIPADTDPLNDRDTVVGGLGNDTILTGDDADLIDAGDGNDSIDAGVDNDTVTAGDGNDTVTGGEGRDSILGGLGNDLIDGGDALFPQADIADDTGDPLTGNNADTIDGGDGNDTIRGGDDGDLISGGVGNDSLDGGVDNDTVDGGTGNDSIDGGQGNDSLAGGADNDTLSGGTGRDTLAGGLGIDRLTGGIGADVFVADGSTPDVITDFDAVTGITTGLAGAPQDDNDFVNLSSFYNAATLAAWNAANPGQVFDNALDLLRFDQQDGVLNQAGGLLIQNGGAAVAANLLNVENTGVVCFTRGTRIMTVTGEREIETLVPGDLILTLDHGYQPIRWIGSTTVPAKGKRAPIVIEAGTLGNTRTLRVSPQHRMLLSGWQAELLYESAEVLVAAKMLVNDQTIRPEDGGTVEYVHMLFDGHEVVFAEGAASESFHPGHVGWGALAETAREEILSLFPTLASDGLAAYGPSARRSLTATEAMVAAELMLAPRLGQAAE